MTHKSSAFSSRKNWTNSSMSMAWERVLEPLRLLEEMSSSFSPSFLLRIVSSNLSMLYSLLISTWDTLSGSSNARLSWSSSSETQTVELGELTPPLADPLQPRVKEILIGCTRSATRDLSLWQGRSQLSWISRKGFQVLLNTCAHPIALTAIYANGLRVATVQSVGVASFDASVVCQTQNSNLNSIMQHHRVQGKYLPTQHSRKLHSSQS